MLNVTFPGRLPRRFLAGVCVLLLMVANIAVPRVDAQAPQTTHDKTWWQAVAKNKFAVPTDVPLRGLLDELNVMLGSPDPEVRDDLAYTALTQWIYRQRVVTVDERARLLKVWTNQLTRGIGGQPSDAVVLRSFSALSLGLLVILDNEAPYLDREQFREVLDASLTYLRDEQDVRGFDARLGWLHSVAHTADVLKFLARSRHLPPGEQARILSAIGEKVTRVTVPLVHGEDERLARAVLSLVARPDWDRAAFVAWLGSMAPMPRTAPPTVATLAVDQNRRNLLVSLFTVLSTDRRDLPAAAEARTRVLEVLRRFM